MNWAIINSMKTKGLVDVNSERLVALNHLVLAGPAHSVLDIDLATKPMLSQALSSIHTEPKLLLLTPETFSAGAVSLRKLESLGLLEDATPLFIYVDSIQELQREFQAGQRYFFYYANQLKDIPDAKEIDRFDESVRYHAVVVASEDMDSARKFLQSLGSMGSRQVFEKYGLTTP